MNYTVLHLALVAHNIRTYLNNVFFQVRIFFSGEKLAIMVQHLNHTLRISHNKGKVQRGVSSRGPWIAIEDGELKINWVWLSQHKWLQLLIHVLCFVIYLNRLDGDLLQYIRWYIGKLWVMLRNVITSYHGRGNSIKWVCTCAVQRQCRQGLLVESLAERQQQNGRQCT